MDNQIRYGVCALTTASSATCGADAAIHTSSGPLYMRYGIISQMMIRSHLIIRALTLVIYSVLLPACIGAGLWGTVHGTIDHPTIGRTKGELAGPGDPFYQEKGYAVKKELLIRYWGEPDKIEILPDRKEKLTYRLGLRWNGIGIWAFIVPIPLVVPVGTDYVQFIIEDGKVIFVETVDEDVRIGGWCGISLMPHNFGPFCEGQRLKYREINRVGDDFRFLNDFDPIKD